MKMLCQTCELRRRPSFRQLSNEEVGAVDRLKSGQVSLPAKANILLPGTKNGPLYTLLAGWAFRYKLVSDGSRQILDILLPGDCIGLQGALLGFVDHGVQALTPVSLCVLDGMPIDTLLDQQPALNRALSQTLMQDGRRADNRLALLGRRTGPQRVAYLMLEIFDRQRELGIGTGNLCHFPLQRQHLADSLGLSGTHVNRSLAELRDGGMATMGNNTLIIHDRDRLAAFAGYKALDGMGNRLIL